MNNDGATIHEYRCPLKSGDQTLGVLRMGMARRDVWSFLPRSAEFVPLAFFGPACCMVAGAVLLNRMVRPVADIEQQLHQVATSPSLESCKWHEVPNVGAAAIGWNRVVQQKLNVGASESLQQRVRQSLEHATQGRWEVVLNNIPEGIATTDAAGRLTYYERADGGDFGARESVPSGNVGRSGFRSANNGRAVDASLATCRIGRRCWRTKIATGPW